MKNKTRTLRKTLVLNADYTPHAIVSCQKGIVLDWKQRVHIVDYYSDDFIKTSTGGNYPIPAVIVLKDYVTRKKSNRVPFSRKNVFIRDKLTCQYCGEKKTPAELTYDHLCPRAKWVGPGTPTNWTNIVTACRSCNTKKADYHISECDGLRGRPKISLIKPPTRPSVQSIIIGLAPWTKIEKEWMPYIPNLYLELLNVRKDFQ